MKVNNEQITGADKHIVDYYSLSAPIFTYRQILTFKFWCDIITMYRVVLYIFSTNRYVKRFLKSIKSPFYWTSTLLEYTYQKQK